MKFIAAFSYLTVLPLPWRFKAKPVAAGEMAVYFPLVGLAIGLALACLRWLCGFILPPAVASALIIAALALLSGARHLSGLAHTADATGGVRMAKTRLQIIKDDNIGSFGIAAVAGILLLKYVALDSLPQNWLLPVLVLTPVIGRWAIVYLLYVFPRVETPSAQRAWRRGTGRGQLIIATVLTFLLSAALILAERTFPTAAGEQIITLTLALITALVIMALTAAAVSLTGFCLTRRLPGLTMETDGAAVEITETLVFILISVLAFVVY